MTTTTSRDTPSRSADSHEGTYDGFVVYWQPISRCWSYMFSNQLPVGGFATSQAAFCRAVEVIDSAIAS